MWYTPTYENCFVELLDLNGQVNYAHLRKLSEIMVRLNVKDCSGFRRMLRGGRL